MFNDKRRRLDNFVSEIDQFLHELDNLPGAKSDARIAMEQQYQRISALRDYPQISLSEELPWKDF